MFINPIRIDVRYTDFHGFIDGINPGKGLKILIRIKIEVDQYRTSEILRPVYNGSSTVYYLVLKLKVLVGDGEIGYWCIR